MSITCHYTTRFSLRSADVSQAFKSSCFKFVLSLLLLAPRGAGAQAAAVRPGGGQDRPITDSDRARPQSE